MLMVRSGCTKVQLKTANLTELDEQTKMQKCTLESSKRVRNTTRKELFNSRMETHSAADSKKTKSAVKANSPTSTEMSLKENTSTTIS